METTSLTFAQPLWFFALILVPVAAALYLWAWFRSDTLIARVVAPRLRNQLAASVHRPLRIIKALLMLSVLVLLVISLARPQWGFTQKEVKQKGRDIIIAIDTSRSMLATDVSPTRLDRAKLVARDLLDLTRGDRVGLIAFAGTAFLQAPLTLDQSAVLTSVDELDTNIIPKGGTNIAAAIRDARDAFGKGEGQTRALIILTDGEELDADGVTASKQAASEGVRIFTVGIGSGEGSLIPLRGDDGQQDFVRDQAGKPVQSRLDESRLREIAQASGGFYEPLSPDVAKILFERGILPMEMTETGTHSSRQPNEQYAWPLSAAAILLAAWMLLGDRRRPAARKNTRVPASATVGFIIALSHLEAATPQPTATPLPFGTTGYDAYQKADYPAAVSDFQSRLTKTPESPKLAFGVGAASYKTGDFEKAIEHFTDALTTTDQKLREESSYNLANALVRRGEAAQDKETKKSDWKNAIQHYSEALNINPQNTRASDNRAIVEKMLEELEKKEKEEEKKQEQNEQQKKDEQQKDDKQDQQNKDQQKKDDQKSKEQKNDKQEKSEQEKKDQQGQGDQEKKDDEQKKDSSDNEQGKSGDKKDESESKEGEQKNQQPPKDKKEGEDKEGEEIQPESGNPQDMAQNKDQQQQAPQPTPAEKKEGELQPAQQQDNQPSEEEAAMAEAEVEKEGEMSAAQARGLLNSLRNEEERVRIIRRQHNEQTIKDW